MLRADQIRSSLFPTAKPIDVSVRPGTVTVIVGPNGAGKTTLLKLLSSEQTALQGRVELNGRPLEDWPATERARQLAVLPQQSLLTFPFTVNEVVALSRTPHATGKRRDSEIIQKVLQLLGAESLQRRVYTQLSGGEKQRVQLARVMAQIWQADKEDVNANARYVLLDEPTNSLDLEHQQITFNAIRTLTTQGCGIALVLHDLNLAAAIADDIVMLHEGGVYCQGSAADVLTAHNIQQVFSVSMTVSQHAVSKRPVLELDYGL